MGRHVFKTYDFPHNLWFDPEIFTKLIAASAIIVVFFSAFAWNMYTGYMQTFEWNVIVGTIDIAASYSS